MSHFKVTELLPGKSNAESSKTYISIIYIAEISTSAGLVLYYGNASGRSFDCSKIDLNATAQYVNATNLLLSKTGTEVAGMDKKRAYLACETSLHFDSHSTKKSSSRAFRWS